MKKFLIKNLLLALPIVGVITLYMLCIEPHRHGDIGQLGFLPFDDNYDSLVLANSLDTNYVSEIKNLQELCGDSVILTIGDSFSQKKKKGYQNFLATLYPNYQVVNLAPIDLDPQFQEVIDFLNYSDTLPQVIIMECVERYLLYRLAYLDFEKKDYIVQNNSSAESEEKTAKMWNEKAENWVEKVRYPILSTQEFLKKRGNIENSVKHVKLSRKLFSCRGLEDDLFFYDEDLNSPDAATVEMGVSKLKELIALAEEKGVKFVFLVAADKYNLYRDYILNDPYKDVVCQLSYFADYQDIHFLNSKELLAPRIANGERDIYMCHDTHWSLKTARYVAEALKQRIENQ